jgi:hypothetical protein
MYDRSLMMQYSLVEEDIERTKLDGSAAISRVGQEGVGRIGNTFNLMLYNIQGNLAGLTVRISCVGLGGHSQ